MSYCKFSVPKRSLESSLLKERFQNLNGQRVCKVVAYLCERSVDARECELCAWPLRIKKRDYALVRKNGKYTIRD